MRTLVVSASLLALATAAFLIVRPYGEALPSPGAAPAVASASRSAPPAGDLLFHVLLALVVVISAGRAMGKLFRWIGQPPVIGEVVTGILLGPSLLGWLAPGWAGMLLPSSAAPALGVLAQLGVILYMFVVGLELDVEALRRRGNAVLIVAEASIAAPFVLGAAMAAPLYTRYAGEQVSFTVFSMFLGAAMSVTAFPVLARILGDRQLTRTPLGSMALACAAIGDVLAWCLLAFVTGVAQSKLTDAAWVVGLTLTYAAAMLVVARPAIAAWAKRYEHRPFDVGALATALVAVLASALATEWIGIHALFGAFLLGATTPHDSRVAAVLREKLEDVVSVLFLPAFFAFTGMRTEIGLVSSWQDWGWCAVIVATATLGKIGGTAIAARATGGGWRDATSLGVLMNTRGLMELIVLNVGLDLGILSPTIFAMLVIMALVTTIATTPALAMARAWQTP